MVVDTSALVAILLDEPEALEFARRIAHAPRAVISAAGYLEFGMLAASRRGYERPDVDDAMSRFGVEIVGVTPHQAQLALDAFARFGKGRHQARLNFGDCFAYALAKQLGQPLLFKGRDFALTDIEAAA